MTEACCTDETEVNGIPDSPPPCTQNSCSLIWSSLREASGFLAAKVRVRGNGVRTDAAVGDTAGVIRCFTDTAGTHQGLDLDLFGQPGNLDSLVCDSYVNPLRRIRNTDSTYSLGTIPFPVQDLICTEEAGCSSGLPDGEADGVFEGCGQQVCAEIINTGCYPMIVVPKFTIRGAELPVAPVTYEIQANLQGEFQTKQPIFSGSAVSLTAAGTGATSSDGDPAHTHSGPSHRHTVSATGRTTYSGTTDLAPVTIAAGAAYRACVTPSVRYDDDYEGGGTINFGDISLCLQGTSQVNAATVAALGGT